MGPERVAHAGRSGLPAACPVADPPDGHRRARERPAPVIGRPPGAEGGAFLASTGQTTQSTSRRCRAQQAASHGQHSGYLSNIFILRTGRRSALHTDLCTHLASPLTRATCKCSAGLPRSKAREHLAEAPSADNFPPGWQGDLRWPRRDPQNSRRVRRMCRARLALHPRQPCQHRPREAPHARPCGLARGTAVGLGQRPRRARRHRREWSTATR